MSKLRTKYKRLKEENKYLKGFNTPIKIKTTLCDVKPYKAKTKIPNSLYSYMRGSLSIRDELVRRELADLIARGIKDQLVINKGEDDGVYTTYTTIIQIGFEGA